MTIIDVARLAGVSPAAVSRCVNKSGYVSAEKAGRIRDSMARLNYTPSATRPGPKPAARKGIRTGAVAFLILSDSITPETIYRMPAFPALLEGIQQELGKCGMHLVMSRYTGQGVVPATLLPRKIDGVLILGALDPMPEQLINSLVALPGVWVMRQHSDHQNQLDHVFYDNKVVGPMAAEYLINRGHRHVAFIMPDARHTAYIERQDAFLKKARTLGVSATLLTLTRKETQTAPSQGVERVVRELVAMRRRPTGLFVPSDTSLIGVFNALRLAGVEPMRDIDLIGCNNDRMALLQMQPRPASIDIKLETVGQKAVEQLRCRMRNFEEPSCARIFISPSLVPAGALEGGAIVSSPVPSRKARRGKKS